VCEREKIEREREREEKEKAARDILPMTMTSGWRACLSTAYLLVQLNGAASWSMKRLCEASSMIPAGVDELSSQGAVCEAITAEEKHINF